MSDKGIDERISDHHRQMLELIEAAEKKAAECLKQKQLEQARLEELKRFGDKFKSIEGKLASIESMLSNLQQDILATKKLTEYLIQIQNIQMQINLRGARQEDQDLIQQLINSLKKDSSMNLNMPQGSIGSINNTDN